MRIYFPVIFFLSVVLFSCEKNDDNNLNNGIDTTSHDFRDVWVGKYHCIENINCYGSCGSCSYTYDTVFSVNYGTTDTTILFLGREIWLDSTQSCYAYHYGMYFRNDSIFSTYMNGGLGCGQYEGITGVKISDIP